MKFPILYKYTTKGQVQQWQIFVSGNQFYAEEGLKGGKLTTSLPTVCSSKNIGKKNETTGNEQAILEAKAKHQKKLDKGYNEILTDEKPFVEPMLANDAKKSKDLTFKKRTFVQPKLDGLRCINEKGTLTSRNGKPYLIPHLCQTKGMIDGELYNHEFHDDFNKIVSLCKKQKPTPEEIAESEKLVEFWAYDFPTCVGVFSDRYKALTKFVKELGNKAVKLVPTYEVHSWEDIKKYHEKFIEEGFEGTIIRIDLGDYEFKRSKQLLKYKDFVDEEFEIVGAEQGEGGRTGTIGKFWMRLDKGLPYSIEEQENVFKSNVKGDFEHLRDVWVNRKKYIGTEATVKYFNRTPDNIPRFPYIIKLNRKEYE